MNKSADPAKRSSILVIDDERGPRESLRFLLNNEFDIQCADSVDQGLDILKSLRPDAIIMDIRMPKKTGIEGLRDIRHVDPNVSVIMFTGYGTLETAQEAIRLGANEYIKKPFDTFEMRDVVRRNVNRTQIERRKNIAEKELSELNQQLLGRLAQKERLANLGQQSAELVHDLRNPLTAVLGCVALLTNELRKFRDHMGDRWQDTVEYLDTIEQSVLRCKDLSDTWLDLGRTAVQPLESISITALLQEVAATCRHTADDRHVSLVLESSDSMNCHVAIHKTQLFRAIQNIVSNAIEAVAPRTGVVKIRQECDNEEVRICVQDNGCGIPPDQIDRIFEPFFTTKKDIGTGLGLFIAQKAMEYHGGKIDVASHIGQGTSFTIRLPTRRDALQSMSA